MLFVDGVKVFDSRQHVPEIDMAAGWIPLFSQSLPDGEHALVFKVAFVSRPANATPTPYLLTRSRVFGGRGKPVSLDLISTALPGTVIHYGSMAVAVGLRSSTHSERSDAEELDAPALSP